MLARPDDPLFTFTPPEPPLIRASRVCGRPVLDRAGRQIGRLQDLALERSGGRIAYAVLDTAGALGSESPHHPLCWAHLSYAPEPGAYRFDGDAADLRDAPPFHPDPLSAWDPTYWRTSVYDFHAPVAARPGGM